MQHEHDGWESMAASSGIPRAMGCDARPTSFKDTRTRMWVVCAHRDNTGDPGIHEMDTSALILIMTLKRGHGWRITLPNLQARWAGEWAWPITHRMDATRFARMHGTGRC